MQAGTVDAAALTAIIRVPEMFTALRYLTAPPISDDDLMSIADVDSLAPGTIARNPAHLTAVAAVIGRLVDTCRFPWITDKRPPTAAFASALDLKWDRIDFDARTIDLYDPAQARNAKGRALVPMNNSAAAALQEAKAAALSDYVIEWNADRVRSVTNGVSAAADRAELPWCTPHVIRHTAARFMAEAGVPMEQIAQYLGHTNVSTTYRIYARYSPTFLQQAAKAVEVGGLRRVV